MAVANTFLLCSLFDPNTYPPGRLASLALSSLSLTISIYQVYTGASRPTAIALDVILISGANQFKRSQN